METFIDAAIFLGAWSLVAICAVCFGALMALLMGETRVNRVGRKVWGRDWDRD